MKASSISSKFVFSQMRFDAKFHLSDGLMVRQIIANSPYGKSLIKDFTSDIYCPGIFKRIYVNSGTPFLGGSDIQKQDFRGSKFLMTKNTPNAQLLSVKKGWTLVTCGGTIGETVFANNLLAKCWISQHVMRLVPDGIKEGMLYAYLGSKYGKLLLTTNIYGSVIPTLNSESIGNLPIPNFPNDFQETVDVLVQESAILREDATNMLRCAEKLLKSEASLKDLTPEDYDYFGPRVSGRKLAFFTKSIKEIGTTTINAFNHSKRIQLLKDSICCHTQQLKDVIENGQTFSSTGVPSVEVAEGKGIMLINQKDIFDNIVKGKWISKRGVKIENLVEYGEVIIASDGTLGENELFCRTLFANESLVGSFLSSHFIRMKTTSEVPSGYLYCWLNSDYGFRFIRSTQAGTKICHPINKLLMEIPVPMIARDKMEEIDRMVRDAHTMRYQANQKELKAIAMVEVEIEKWKN